MSELELREFDVARIKRELEESLPIVRAQVAALEEAKRVSRKVLNYEVTI